MIKLSQLILEQKIEVVKDDWSKGLEEPVVTLSNGKSYQLYLVNQEFEDGNYMYFFETDELPGYEFTTIGYEDDPTYIDSWEVDVYSSKLPKEIPGFEGTRDALDNLSIRESKNFDLKKYLIENKLTTNSRILKESKEVTVVKTDWSGGVDEPVVTLSNGEEYTLELIRREYEDGYYTYDYVAPEAPGYGFFTVGNDEDPEVMGGWEVYSTRKGIREGEYQQGVGSRMARYMDAYDEVERDEDKARKLAQLIAPGDSMVQMSAKYGAAEVLTIGADAVGDGSEGRYAYDGVFTQDDFKRMFTKAGYSEDAIETLMDSEYVQYLERG